MSSIPMLTSVTSRPQIRSTKLITLVERICGLEVTEVNIGIDDIHLPGEQDTTTTTEPRVQ